MAEKPPTAAEFEQWLHPSDVVQHYINLGEREAKARVIAMLGDGLLRAAAIQLIVRGKDHGLAILPRDTWELAGRTDVWVTGRFRLSAKGVSISAYDVRIDPEIRELPRPVPAPAHATEKPPAPSATKGKGGRSSGHHGIVIATIAKRLLALPEMELQAYSPQRLQSELIEGYHANGCPPPSAENVRLIAAGILKALRN